MSNKKELDCTNKKNKFKTDIENVNDFYSFPLSFGDSKKRIDTLSSPSETFYHKAIKKLIQKLITKNNSNITECTTEKYINNRRADVFLKLKNGNNIAIEIQHSVISYNEIKLRTKAYNDLNTFVLWILHSNGKCVGSPKPRKNIFDVRISPAEKFLHRIYGGRVYYVSIDEVNFKISYPYALYFSPSLKYPINIQKDDFQHYFIRNINYVLIPDWRLFCMTSWKNNTSSGFKIARFSDKNFLTILRNDIKKYTSRNFQNKALTKENIHEVLEINYEISKLLVYKCLIRLKKDKEIDIEKKPFKKIYNYLENYN